MNNIVLDVDGHRCVATVLYHRNGEFKIKLPREKLHDFCIHLSKSIEIYFYFNMKWSEIILSHIANELKAVGFSNVKLVCPYLPFGRANKPEKEYGCRKDILSTFFEMLKAAGIDEVCTSDFHLNIKSNIFHGIKFRNIKFSELWQEEITKISRIHNNDKFLVFAPDSGAVDRAWQTWTVLSHNLPSNPLYCKHIQFCKERIENGIEMFDGGNYANNEQYQNRICIIVDDMIDSGKTILAAIEKVREFKPKKIYVLVTHLLNDEFKAPADVELMWKFDSVQEA